jgi:hypothetical protein
MDRRYLELFQETLHFIIPRFKKYTEQYFGGDLEFTSLEKDLFDNYMFGYKNCGHMALDDKHVYFHFEINGEIGPTHMSMTIWFILKVLNNMLWKDEVEKPDRPQFIKVETLCQIGSEGHSTGGYISPDLGKWLKKQSEDILDENAFSMVILPEVGEVMRQVYESISHRKLDPNECRALISQNGLFGLKCPGDSCDVSIYYDQVYGDPIGNRFVEFSSHNLDNPTQQITLLAGLAKLCELARNDE